MYKYRENKTDKVLAIWLVVLASPVRWLAGRPTFGGGALKNWI